MCTNFAVLSQHIDSVSNLRMCGASADIRFLLFSFYAHGSHRSTVAHSLLLVARSLPTHCKLSQLTQFKFKLNQWPEANEPIFKSSSVSVCVCVCRWHMCWLWGEGGRRFAICSSWAHGSHSAVLVSPFIVRITNAKGNCICTNVKKSAR